MYTDKPEKIAERMRRMILLMRALDISENERSLYACFLLSNKGWSASNLSDYSGTSRPTILRLLNRWESRGYVYRNKHRQWIMTPESLEHISNVMIETEAIANGLQPRYTQALLAERDRPYSDLAIRCPWWTPSS